MSMKYDISKKSDMRKFRNDLEKQILDNVEKEIKKSGIEIECPNCNKKFKAKDGKTTCPHCKKVIDLDINM